MSTMTVKSYAKSLAIGDFQGSGEWTDRFKVKHGLAYETICGEAKKVDTSVIED